MENHIGMRDSIKIYLVAVMATERGNVGIFYDFVNMEAYLYNDIPIWEMGIKLNSIYEAELHTEAANGGKEIVECITIRLLDAPPHVIPVKKPVEFWL